jgi:hypothetical protein
MATGARLFGRYAGTVRRHAWSWWLTKTAAWSGLGQLWLGTMNFPQPCDATRKAGLLSAVWCKKIGSMPAGDNVCFD